MQEKNWYHALPHAALTLAALIGGILYIWLGASLSEPYYFLDDVLLRMLGLGLLAGSVLLLRTSHLGFSLVGASFALGAMEFALSSALADQPHEFREIFFICSGQLALSVLAFWLDYTFYHATLEPIHEVPALKRSDESPLDTHWLNVLMQYLVVIFTVAAVSLLITAPALTLARGFSFAMLGVLALLFVIVHGRPAGEQRTFAPLLGFAAAALLLLPIAGISERMEHGYSDGPFLGTPHTTELSKMRPSYRLKYRDGMLAVYNRSRRSAPLLVYYNDDEPVWATELYIPLKPGSKHPLLLRISSPEIQTGLLRDTLEFKSHSRGDSGHGEAYIWRFGGIQRFYLKW